MPGIRASLAALLALLTPVLPASAQQAPGATTSPASRQGTGPEIVVTAPVDLDALPTQAEGPPEARSVSRALGSEAERFVRCTGMPEPGDLRVILDNSPGDSRAMHALHKFIVRNRGCYGTVVTPLPETPFFGACNPHLVSNSSYNLICRTTFDRGALYERAVKAYGEDILLTRMQTFDPATRDRFRRHAQEADKLRVPVDRTYAAAVGCMVQISPRTGRELLQAAPGSAEETRARRVLIGYGGACVGEAATVTVDPAQFRAYTAEAVYAWLVAAANRTTLVAD